MKYVIQKENRPVYLQLYKLIRNDIINQVYPYNSRLPSKRMLAEELGISTITIEHAYGLLCDEGYAEARERSGYLSAFGWLCCIHGGACTACPRKTGYIFLSDLFYIHIE